MYICLYEVVFGLRTVWSNLKLGLMADEKYTIYIVRTFLLVGRLSCRSLPPLGGGLRDDHACRSTHDPEGLDSSSRRTIGWSRSS